MGGCGRDEEGKKWSEGVGGEGMGGEGVEDVSIVGSWKCGE